MLPGEHEYLTVGEFSRTMEAIRQQISDGFALTHQKQNITNGRISKAEQTLAVISNARLIDRTDSLEGDVRDLKGDATRAQNAKQRWTTVKVAVVGAGCTTTGALLILIIKAVFHL